jgi:hypothetical protein
VPAPGRPLHSAQPVSQFTIHLFLGESDDRLLHDKDQVRGCARPVRSAPEALSNEPPRTIADRRLSDPATHRYSESVGGTTIRQNDEKKVPPIQPSTSAEHTLELRAPPQALCRREAPPAHDTLLRRQAASRFRPFCRRLFSTRRPLFLRMRTRNP